MAKTREDLPNFDVKEVFEYKDGHLFWKQRGRGRKVDKPIGTKQKSGYLVTNIHGRCFYLHRLIYLFHTGIWPELIDHIDGNKSNNNINNLRSASKSLNALNLNELQSNNKSGFRGVYWSKRAKKWVAQVTINRRIKYLGCFENIIDAANIVNEAMKPLSQGETK